MRRGLSHNGVFVQERTAPSSPRHAEDGASTEQNATAESQDAVNAGREMDAETPTAGVQQRPERNRAKAARRCVLHFPMSGLGATPLDLGDKLDVQTRQQK